MQPESIVPGSLVLAISVRAQTQLHLVFLPTPGHALVRLGRDKNTVAHYGIIRGSGKSTGAVANSLVSANSRVFQAVFWWCMNTGGPTLFHLPSNW